MDCQINNDYYEQTLQHKRGIKTHKTHGLSTSSYFFATLWYYCQS